MARRIIILSDGTGNAAASVWRTNVWRIFQSLDLRSNVQVAKYDDGVGTSSFKPLTILGGVFGWGLKRNVIDAYKFICRNHDDGAQIFLFGFSRGAFTARVIAGLVLNQGLVKAQSESELHDLALKAYRAYRSQGYHSILGVEIPFRKLRDGFSATVDKLFGRKPYDTGDNIFVPSIEFLGLWDTVAAYGLPVDEMTRGVSDWIWPLNLPDRVLSPRVRCARHAVALDDERTTFHPVLWTEEDEETPPAVPYSTDQQRLVQVWFTGMHANVGGGYPDDALAFVPLYWILEEAKKRGLEFKSDPEAEPDTTKWVQSARDKDGRLYNSRSGLGGYYRYGPRKVHDLCNDPDAGVKIDVPKIHHSVFGRIDSGANAYAPIGLPERYSVVNEDGTVATPTFETSVQATNRREHQELLWNYVWCRRITYFATLAATAHLVLFPFIHSRNREHEFESPIRLVSEIIRLLNSFLPSAFKWWIDWYAANPEWFVGGLIVLFGLLVRSTKLQGKILDSMRLIWASRGSQTPISSGYFQRGIYWLRSSAGYRWLIRTAKLRVLPFLFAISITGLSILWASHLAFNVADSAGVFCKGTDDDKLVPVNLGIEQPAQTIFETHSLCQATGLKVQAGYRYEIVITPQEPWKDASIETSPAGFGSASRPVGEKWLFRFFSPLRRIFFRPWYMAVARIGERGVDEYFLDPVRVKDSNPPAYRGSFMARRSGEVFAYVNDAVIPLPWLVSTFYRNNSGTAKITLKLK